MVSKEQEFHEHPCTEQDREQGADNLEALIFIVVFFHPCAFYTIKIVPLSLYSHPFFWKKHLFIEEKACTVIGWVFYRFAFFLYGE